MVSHRQAGSTSFRSIFSPASTVIGWSRASRTLGRQAGIIVLAVLSLYQPAHLQVKETFGINKVVSEVRTRFKLSPRDVKSIRPLIIRSNQNVFEIYVRFGREQPEYSNRVWIDLISRRRDFAASVGSGLTARQKAALHAARKSIERRVLNYLVEDYVSFLGDFLELDDRQFSLMQDLFDADNRRKYQFFETHQSNPQTLPDGFESMTRETEREVRKILSGEQWRDYLSLTELTRQVA